jgi:hypothetical protein
MERRASTLEGHVVKVEPSQRKVTGQWTKVH